MIAPSLTRATRGRHQRPVKSFSVRLGVVERSALRALIELQVVEEIIDDLAVVEADLRKGAAADLDDLVDVTLAARVG